MNVKFLSDISKVKVGQTYRVYADTPRSVGKPGMTSSTAEVIEIRPKSIRCDVTYKSGNHSITLFRYRQNDEGFYNGSFVLVDDGNY